jgi:hypothetical protein
VAVVVELSAEQAGHSRGTLLTDPGELAMLRAYPGDPSALAEVR